MRVEASPETQVVKKKKGSWRKLVLSLFVLTALVVIVQQAFDTSTSSSETDTQEQNVLGESTSQPENTVRVRLSEEELNNRLQEQIGQSSQGNTLADAHIEIQDSLGILRMRWEGGQTLEAQIVVGDSQKELVVRNARVEGAGILNSVFETLAKSTIDQALKIITNKQGDRLVSLAMVDGALHAYYRLAQ
ncbi:MAG: hypothetical protein H6760_00525 [Candidatus Nomurabacteria bacterium]|nr:MAG: hypothetical protein H6760_00525 [Candidatus Nomurabacteria bacterium]